MDILITKKNTTVTTPETVNFTALLAHSDISSLPLQSRFIELLNEEFTEEELKLYIANLYMYLNYNSTLDYPINLETVYKMIGFANKGNAMKTIKSNFTKDEDYKTIIFPMEKNKLTEETRGRKEETIMLNVDTFKSLCMLVKTPEGKKIRKYYVKLENVNNKITKEQLENKDKLLKDTQNELIEQELKNQRQEVLINEKDAKLNNLTRKVTKYPAGKAIYAYETVFEGKKVKKVGKAKDVNKRITDHRTADPDVDIFYSIKCYDHHLFEKTCHFLLDKWRVSKNRVFDCSTQIIKNVMNYTKLVLENNINFETICVDEITEFFNTYKIEEQNENEELQNQIEIEEPLPVHPEIDIVLKDCNNFELFLQECCDIDNNTADCTHKEIVNQYKIWCKTSNKEQCKKLTDFLKTRFTSVKKKVTNAFIAKKDFFIGIKLKSEFYEFINGDSIIEKFLFEKCKRSPNYQISKSELLGELNSDSDIIKNKILNYFDINFTRTRIGDVIDKKDLRQRGYLGVALKTSNNPENIPKVSKILGNPKKVYQIEVSTKKVLREFDSQIRAAEFMNVSASVMYYIMKTGRQSDNYIFSYNKNI
jgi:phage anti-repressor protein